MIGAPEADRSFGMKTAYRARVEAGLCAGEVFDSIRALFAKTDPGKQQVDINEIILDVIQSMQGLLKDHRVATHLDFAVDLPFIKGHKGQLREVILNLVNNAVEAMDSTANRSRVLKVRTELVVPTRSP